MGHVIKQQAGTKYYKIVEEIRLNSKNYRATKNEKYLNEIFTITREVKDKVTNIIQTTADYSELGLLLITVTVLTLVVPILFVKIIQNTKFKTDE